MSTLQRTAPSTPYTLPFLQQLLTHQKPRSSPRAIHAHILKTQDTENHQNFFILDTLLTSYMRCGQVDSARRLFGTIRNPTEVTWTSFMSGLVQNGHLQETLALHYPLMLRSQTPPNNYTFSTLLKACAGNAGNARVTQQLHAAAVKWRHDRNGFVGTALLDAYAKCGRAEDACQVFDKMPKELRNHVCYTSLVSLHIRNGNACGALRLFAEMECHGIQPDSYAFSAAFRACAEVAALEKGRSVHCRFVRAGLYADVSVENSVVFMYLKCGSLREGERVFQKMACPNAVTWSSMISGFAHHGKGEKALELFDNMQRTGADFNQITFIGVLSACSSLGLVKQGRAYFKMMKNDYGLTPHFQHYACMVDLLGRGGCLEEAEDFIRNMPIQPNAVIWRSFLFACRMHGNLELGSRAGQFFLDLGIEDAGAYVLLSNMFASVGKWDLVGRVRKLMRDRGVKKHPGCSWIEIRDHVHCFLAGDSSEM